MANTTTTGGHASAGDVKHELAEDAQQLSQTATDQAESKAREGQQMATNTARATSSAIEKAADALRDDDNAPDWLAQAASSAARQVDELAEQLNGTNPREMARWTSDFARENPTSFLAASAALGFAAARFLRAGADYQHNSQSSGSAGGVGQRGGQGDTTYRMPASSGTTFAGATVTGGTGGSAASDRQPATIGGGYGEPA